LRLAGALSKREEAEVRVFLMHRAEVACCGTCLDARAHRGAARGRGATLDAGRTDRLDALGRPDADVLTVEPRSPIALGPTR
jgi:hypothetical protein